jgi:hypothetical protein
VSASAASAGCGDRPRALERQFTYRARLGREQRGPQADPPAEPSAPAAAPFRCPLPPPPSLRVAARATLLRTGWRADLLPRRVQEAKPEPRAFPVRLVQVGPALRAVPTLTVVGLRRCAPSGGLPQPVIVRALPGGLALGAARVRPRAERAEAAASSPTHSSCARAAALGTGPSLHVRRIPHVDPAERPPCTSRTLITRRRHPTSPRSARCEGASLRPSI